MKNPLALLATLSLATLTIGLALASPVAVAFAIAIVAIVAFGPLTGPDHSYLDRAPQERVVVGVVVDATPARLPVAVVVVDTVEIARLTACEARAIAGRQRARAAAYRARIAALTSGGV